MVLSRFVRVQLIIFSVVTVLALSAMGVYYMQIPSQMGVGRHTVLVDLPSSGGLYKTSNVTYRGATIGSVLDVSPTVDGATAKLSMDSSVQVPADVTAEVHSRSALGEQYIDMVPNALNSPYLQDGSVIPADRTTIPQDIAPMLDTANRNLAAIAPGKLTTLIDESYAAFNGTGPDIQRLLDSSNEMVQDANTNIQATTNLIDNLPPVLEAQMQSADNIYAWARNINNLTAQMKDRDQAIQSILQKGPGAANAATTLFQDLKPTLPLLLDNLTSLGQVGATYNSSLETVLVVAPQLMGYMTTLGIPNKGGTVDGFLSFNLGNLNSPEPCTTGYLPASERRSASALDAPLRTDNPMYCAIPQDAPLDVRGARNLPCMDNPGKRAPTVDICKSDDDYQPRGTNPWIGDPLPVVDNPLADQIGGAAPASTTQVTPSSYSSGTPPSGTKPVGTASYDPKTGKYQGSDGATYALSSIAPSSSREGPTWKTMLMGRTV